MPYVPVSVDVYVAAYAGIMGAIANVRQTTDAVAADYDHDTKVAGAFAQAFDAAYNNATPNELQLEEIQSLSNEIFSNIFPTGAGSELVTGPGYTALANAIIARLTQADAFFAGQGIVPPVITPVETLGPFNTVATGVVGSGRLLDVTAAQIAALKTSGSVAWVNSVKDFWRWDSLSTLVADNIKVCNPTANGVAAGRFIRELIPAPEWMLQLTWFIDGANSSGTASDENDGATAVTPLLTDLERIRRMGPHPVWNGVYHLRYISDLAFAKWQGTVAGQTSAVFRHGSATDGQGQSVLFTGTIDALTAEAPATNTPWQITANGLPVSWTASALVNARLRDTQAGAQLGLKSWAVKDLGAKQARFCEFGSAVAYGVPFNAPATVGVPVAGDTFVIERLTVITNCIDELFGIPNLAQGQSNYDSLNLGNGGGFTIATTCKTILDGCAVTLTSVGNAGNVTSTNCQFQSGAIIQDTFQQWQAFAGYVRGGSSWLCLCSLFGNFLSQGGGITLRFNGQNHFGNGSNVATQGVAIFDATSGNGCIIAAYGAMALFDGAIWGSGNTVPLGFCLPNSYLNYTNAFVTGGAFVTLYTLASTQATFSMVSRTAVPAFDQATSLFTAPRNLTIANLAATVAAGGFGVSVMDPATGCGIQNT